jgi:hypothetical protein
LVLAAAAGVEVAGFIDVMENPVDVDDAAAAVSPALVAVVPKLKPTVLGAAAESGAVVVEPKLKPVLVLVVVLFEAPKLNPVVVAVVDDGAVAVELLVVAVLLVVEGPPKFNIPPVEVAAAVVAGKGVAVLVVVPKEKPPVDAAGIEEGVAPRANPVVVGVLLLLEAAPVVEVAPNEKGAGAVVAVLPVVEPKLNPLDPAPKGAAVLPLFVLVVEEPNENPDTCAIPPPPAAAAAAAGLLALLVLVAAGVVVEPKLNDILDDIIIFLFYLSDEETRRKNNGEKDPDSSTLCRASMFYVAHMCLSSLVSRARDGDPPIASLATSLY